MGTVGDSPYKCSTTSKKTSEKFRLIHYLWTQQDCGRDCQHKIADDQRDWIQVVVQVEIGVKLDHSYVSSVPAR